jgi:hypothetical protein
MSVTQTEDGSVFIDGQDVDYYYTEEGRAARRKAARLAHEDEGCFPPCPGDCCLRVRSFMATSEYTGRPRQAL